MEIVTAQKNTAIVIQLKRNGGETTCKTVKISFSVKSFFFLLSFIHRSSNQKCQAVKAKQECTVICDFMHN